MKNFIYETPTKVYFGKDEELKVGKIIAEFHPKKVLVHFGGNSARKSGLLDKVENCLKEENISFVELGGVVANPELPLVREGIELGKKEGVDFVLAVGGGSVLDSSKAIANGLANPEVDVWDFHCGKAVPQKTLPKGAILTLAAAGSDARMGGCSMPVVINSGSGNQGMTVSLPVIVFADEWEVSHEKLCRSLVVSNLIAIHQKYYIGSLSAYCGAVSAACGAGAGITYMYGGTYQQVSLTIINTLGNIGGIVCDGAKPSCAAKIATSVDAALMAFQLSIQNKSFLPGEGIIKDDIEETIKSMGYIGRVGMRTTDTEILNVMIDRADINEEC